jgi:hypothetical protein
VEFALSGVAEGAMRAEVFDVSGRLVNRLWEGRAELGERQLTWLGEDLAGGRARPGMYVVRVDQAGRRVACRFVLLR